MNILQKLRQRQVLTLAGVYVVGAWVFIEVSSVFFPAWGIPDTALRYLFVAAAVLFPIVILFGWLFDVRRDGLYRTITDAAGQPTAATLRRQDFVVLSGLTGITVAVLLVTLMQVWNSIDAAPVTAAEVARTENSVAILPFANLDPNPDTAYFSDGVSEEILHRLAGNQAVHVLGRSSSFAFRNSDLSLADISRLLAVQYLLEGSVRRDGNVVRVTARLTDQSGVQVWSETFDRRLEAIFAIQSEIAASVASRIVQEIVATGGSRVERTTESMEAYDEYLVGKALTHARGRDWDIKSEAAFRRAIELDPDFAPAYAGLAYSLFIMSDASAERVEGALAAARKSLELDPDLALGHAVLGVMQGTLGLTSLEKAEQRLRRALELDPALSDAYNWLSINLRDQGRLEEADAAREQAYKIDPLHPSIAGNFANTRANFGDYDHAMRILEPFTRLPQMGGGAIAGLFGVNFEYGRYAEALKFNSGPEHARVYAALGMFDVAARRIGEIRNAHRREVVKQNVWRMRGEHEQAWASMQEYLAEYNYVFEELDPDSQAWILETQALGGDYARAIERFESLGDGEPLTWIRDLNAFGVGDLQNAIGFAYLQTGDADKAAALLSVETPALTHFKPYLSPVLLDKAALNASLRGDDELALEHLSLAVDKGWANYYRAINDPRWGDTLSQPRFNELLERVRTDIARQRAEVEAMLAHQPDG